MNSTVDYAAYQAEQQPAPEQQPIDPPQIAALATPPILTRNTYPPGMPSIGAAPKPLKATPTSINQIASPDGAKATHFQGPLVSGPTPGVQGAIGSAKLVLTVQLDWSMGNFSIPIQFPGGSFLQGFNAACYETGLPAGIAVSLGSQQNGSDIAVWSLPAKGSIEAVAPPLKQMPVWSDSCPFCPFQCWLTVTGNTGSTVGGVLLFIEYLRCAGPWSTPAGT